MLKDNVDLDGNALIIDSRIIKHMIDEYDVNVIIKDNIIYFYDSSLAHKIGLSRTAFALKELFNNNFELKKDELAGKYVVPRNKKREIMEELEFLCHKTLELVEKPLDYFNQIRINPDASQEETLIPKEYEIKLSDYELSQVIEHVEQPEIKEINGLIILSPVLTVWPTSLLLE